MRALFPLFVLLSAAALAGCAPRLEPPAPGAASGAHGTSRQAARLVIGSATFSTTPPPTAAPASSGPPLHPPSAAYVTACHTVGGTIASSWGADWAPGVCIATYPGQGTQPVTLNPNGSMNWIWAGKNQVDCGVTANDVQFDAAAHQRWRSPPQYHPSTGICYLGNPG